MMAIRPVIGPIDTSIPPPPLMIAGVLATPTSANGANPANVAAYVPGSAKAGSTLTFTTINTTVRTSANMYVCARMALVRFVMPAQPPEEIGHESVAIELAAFQLRKDRSFAEDEHTVRQLHQLINIGRDHDHQHSPVC